MDLHRDREPSILKGMRRIKKVKVTHLALCKRGKNQLPVLYKAEDGEGGAATVEVQTIVKAMDDFDDHGELLVIGWAPEHRDIEGDIADAEVCKAMGHSFMREGARLNIRHGSENITRDRAFVAESFTIQKSDERFHDLQDYQGNDVDVTGGWAALIKIEDPELRRLYREEGWNGISLQGEADGTYEPTTNKVQKARDLFRANHTDDRSDNPTQEYDMKPEELEAILKGNREATLALLTPLIKAQDPAPVVPPVAPAKPIAKAEDEPKIEFTGDPLNKEEVAEHLRQVKAARLAKSVDWNDPKAVENHLATLAKMDPDNGDPGDDDDDVDDLDDEGEPKPRRKPIAKSADARARGRSDQNTADPRNPRSKIPSELREFSLSKEEIAGLDCADRMAAFINAPYKDN